MLARSLRRGLTLVEVLIVLAILATLAAVLYPAVVGQLREGQATALANQLDNLRVAIANYRTNVVRYPRLLTQLTVQPGAGALDICGVVVPAANRALWRGPYLAQNILGNFPVGDATVQNTLVRVVTAAPVANLQIDAVSVDSTSAAYIERQFDGTPLNYATGSILWVSTGPAVGDLTYQIPIRGC
ncbi:MAG: prepilin-type N-terminal cleavage/methylation domain-containing protein [Gemmatimonadota bacterium]